MMKVDRPPSGKHTCVKPTAKEVSASLSTDLSLTGLRFRNVHAGSAVQIRDHRTEVAMFIFPRLLPPSLSLPRRLFSRICGYSALFFLPWSVRQRGTIERARAGPVCRSISSASTGRSPRYPAIKPDETFKDARSTRPRSAGWQVRAKTAFRVVGEAAGCREVAAKQA